MSRGPIKRVSGICYPRCQHCKAEIISSKQWRTAPCPQSEAWTSPNREHPGHDIYPKRSMRNWATSTTWRTYHAKTWSILQIR